MIEKIDSLMWELADDNLENVNGRTAFDAPDIDGKVYFRAAIRPAPGSYVDVQISDVVDYDLFGEAVQTK